MVDVTYRPVKADDFSDLHRIASHWSVVRQLGRWPWPPDPAFTKSHCKPFQGNGFIWAVCIDDQLIGTMAATQGELGYKFAPQISGQGIATKATRDAIDTAFTKYDWPVLKASVWEDNPSSARVLQKCGFTHWQTRYTRSPTRFPTLVHQYRLPRFDWDRLRTRTQ